MKYFFVILLWILHSFSALAQCDEPIYLEANNISSSSADLAWTPQGDELYWTIEWGNDGFTLGEGNIIDSLTSPEYLLINLEAETSYDYYVWALCEEDSSAQSALEFMTLPINNTTCDALVIEINGDSSTLVNNTNAIPYGPDPACWGEHLTGDLWYMFELTEASGIEIITEEGVSNDSHIALYQINACEDDSVIYQELYCSEDISGNNWMSHIITEELEPGSYYIQCGTYFNAIGDYSISVNSATPIVLPPNNDCSGAIVNSVSVNGDTLSITGSGLNATDENFMGGAHVWEAFTLDTCADVLIDFCGSSPSPTAIYTNLYADCPTTSPVQSGTFMSSVCEANGSVHFQNIDAGTYYYPVVADSNNGGYYDYTLNISAVSCTIEPQPDTCTTWLNGPWGDFNSNFGGAPFPDSTGVCPVYFLDNFSVYASESYDVDNFIESYEYTVSVCYGEGAGTWPVELAIIDTLGNIIAWADSCQITFISPVSGPLVIGINESGACGSTSSNTSTDNGYLAMTCGGIVLDVNQLELNDFSIYPNPSNGIVSIQNNSSNANFNFSLLSVSGKTIYTEEMQMQANEVKQIQLPRSISKGLYLVKWINLDDQSYSIKRLIVE